MPALQAFGTKWKIGSDDLVFPFIGSICIRVYWIVVIGLAVVFFSDDDNCTEMNLLKVYLIVVIALHIAMMIVELAGCIVSSRGAIANPKPREHIYIILYVLLACFLVEIVWDIIGFVWAFDPNLECYQRHFLLTFIRCLLFWNAFASIAATAFLFIRIGVCKILWVPKKMKFEDVAPAESFGGRRLSKISSDSMKRRMHRRRWLWRLQALFCCVRIREFQKSVFSEVSVTLSDAFRRFRGYVPSDLLAGLLLVSMEKEDCTTNVMANNDEDNEIEKEQTYCILKKGCKTLKKLPKYFAYASAIYGYPCYLQSNKVIGPVKLLQNCCHKRSAMGGDDNIAGDNACHWNLTALLNTTGLRKEDLLFVQFQPEIYLPAFYVAVDHKEKAMVLSIRGTKTLHDLLTDLAAQPTVVSSENCEDFHAHTGCLEAAQAILFKLKAEGILDSAFTLYPNYELVVTGHSLGAGTAVIISILMKTVYKNVHCYAFSPPGGLLSENAASFTRSFVTTVVLGDDIIPRLSLQSMEDLGQRILHAIKSCDLPKYKIYLRSLLYWIGFKLGGAKVDHSTKPLLNVLSEVDSADEMDIVSGKRALPVILDRQDLHLPGKILHIRTSSSKHYGDCITSNASAADCYLRQWYVPLTKLFPMAFKKCSSSHLDRSRKFFKNFHHFKDVEPP